MIDPLGCHAIAIGMMASDIDLRRELPFDPTTDGLLSEREVIATAAAVQALDGPSIGTAAHYSAVVSCGVVASDHATPSR